MTGAVVEVPSDWDVKTLGSLGRVVRGSSPRPAGDPRFFNGTFIPWLTVASLTTIPDSQMYVTKTSGLLTEEGAKRSRKLVPDTLVISNSGATLGVAKILKLDCCANDGIAALIEQHAGNKEFLCQYLNTLTNYLREVVAPGNGQPNLNTTLIHAIEVPFPDEKEQEVIATVLRDADDLITSLVELLSKKRDIKQGMMQELLSGGTRLPGFGGRWGTRKLGDIATVVMGQSPAGASYNELGDGVPLIQGNADIRDRWTFDRVWTTQPTKEVEAGNVVLTVRAPVGFTALASKDACLGRGVCGVAAGPSTRFLFHALVAAESSWASLEQGSTFTAVNGDQVRAFELDWPDDEHERIAIAAVLTDADSELAALERRLESARAIKTGMMQELLTGRSRLPLAAAS